MNAVYCFILFVFFMNWGCASNIVYLLGAGDKIQVTVFNQQNLTAKHTLDGHGKFSMPFIGLIDAHNLSVADLQSKIIALLKPDYLINPRVSIEVLNYRPYYILGEIKTPSSYPYVNGMTYLNAVVIAGGFSYRAKKKYAYVIHADDKKQHKIKVKFTELVQPGDVITIEERYF